MLRGKPKGLSCKEDALDPQQVTKLLLVCPALRDRFIAYCLLYAGLRVSELKHLKRSWVNLEEGTITISTRQFCDFAQLEGLTSIPTSMQELTTASDVDEARLLPQLFDRLIALGQIAQQLSYALGGNGHHPVKTRDLIEQLRGGRS